MTQHADIDHTGLTGVGGGGNPVLYDIEQRSAGDLAVVTTSAGTAIPTLGYLVVACVTGDLLMIGLDCVVSADSESIRFDVASIVAAAAVNYVSNGTGTPAGVGIAGWSRSVTTLEHVNGTFMYVAQAGDLSGGNITLGLRSWLASGTSRTVQASSSALLTFWVQNLGQ
jgi:hypothetical protein